MPLLPYFLCFTAGYRRAPDLSSWQFQSSVADSLFIRIEVNGARATTDTGFHVAYSCDPKLRRRQYRAAWWDPRFEEPFQLRLGQVPGIADELLGRSLGPRFHFVQHHLAHAASAYFPSGFDRAAILTVDGIGEVAGSALANAAGQRIPTVETIDDPHSIGFMWEVFSD